MNMFDTALLENAAKAAGIVIEWWDDGGPGLVPGYTREPDEFGHGGWCWCIWNPLEDDGDAFRLMMTLRLVVRQQDDHVKVGWAGCEQWVGETWAECDEHIRPTATRRAIVRAAAEIGRRMK